jgi:Phosphoglycerate kinase
VAGFLLQKELDYLDGAVSDPKKPFAAIVGGSKVSTKITVIESLLEKAQKVCPIPLSMICANFSTHIELPEMRRPCRFEEFIMLSVLLPPQGCCLLFKGFLCSVVCGELYVAFDFVPDLVSY